MEIPRNGCCNTPPLESDFILEVSRYKHIRVMLTHLSLGLPSPFKAFLMQLLNIDQVHHLVPQGLHIPIQNRHRPLDIIQETINTNVLQGNHNYLIGHILR